jgi:hypothetical protein
LCAGLAAAPGIDHRRKAPPTDPTQLATAHLVLASFFRRRLSLVDENVLRLRVLPNDVDVTRLSSDRYLPLMDLGRINIVLRAGLLGALVRHRWIPIARVSRSASGIH